MPTRSRLKPAKSAEATMEEIDIQAEILKMIRTRKIVRSRDFVRELQGWDFRKAITRLRRQGYPIENLSPPGIEGAYAWTEGLNREDIDNLMANLREEVLN